MQELSGVLNVGSFILTALSIVAAVYFFFASRSEAKPSYQWKSLVLLGSSEAALPDDVRILFRGEPVIRLTKTYVVFWNAGRSTLKGTDIVADDPLRMEVGQGERVLETKVITLSRTSNKFRAHVPSPESNQARFDFDYLDLGHGALIEILHTDLDSSPKIEGSIRGVPKGIRSLGKLGGLRSPPNIPWRFPWYLPFIVMVTMGVILMLMGLVPYFAPTIALEVHSLFFVDPPTFDPGQIRWSSVIIGALYVAPMLVIGVLMRRRCPKELMVKEID